MAALDGSTKSLMQGVSQQVPRERLDGQVSLQENMLSDVVQGMRRRPGYRLRSHSLFPDTTWTREQIFATSVDIEDTTVHVLVNTATGTLVVYDDNWTLLNSGVFPYLQAASASNIQTGALRGYLYLCNTTKLPAKVVDNTGKLNPDQRGFFFTKTGAYSKLYQVSLTVGGVLYSAQYSTPDGTQGGDAANSTPEAITANLVASFVAQGIPNVSYIVVGPYAYIETTTAGQMSVATDIGTTFIGTSNLSHVAQVSDLPARLPNVASGYVVSVGASERNSVYYRYDFPTNRWVEAGAYNSAGTISNMPMRLKLDTSYLIEAPTYEGRLAGDDDTNEDPVFMTDGVTGMGVFQGRLVLLSGPSVVMSASGKPLRWYRSTVSELLVNDPISVYSGAATSTNFSHAVQFNKDLLLFSNTCQAVVPSGNAIVAPTTAQIVITSSYSSTSKVSPIVAGRSLLYFAPRSESYAGVLELVPSNTTDSQYTTNDVTAHIPQYMPGVVRQATASTTSNSIAIVCDGDARSVFIQNYLWAEDKVQSAWHRWTSPYDVACTWFVRDTVYFGMVIDGALRVVSAEPQAGDTINGLHRPFSDVYSSVVVTDRAFTVPDALRTAYGDGVDLLLTYASGELAGEWVGVEDVNTTSWVGTTVRNIPNGTYMVGLRYRSALSPTPPLMRDQQGVVISSGHSTLIRYELSLKDTGTFNVTVLRGSELIHEGEYSALLYSSQDLLPNAPLVNPTSRVLVPIRALSQDTNTTFYTDGEHDLGILTLEWVLQHHPRRRRAS